MMRTLGGNGAIIGTGPDSAVLEFQQLPAGLTDRFPAEVKVIALNKDGVFDESNFIVRWRADGYDIRFIATKGRATAIGHAIVRQGNSCMHVLQFVQPTSILRCDKNDK